jgi:hypothetical protein
MQPHDKRPRLDSILSGSGSGGNFDDLWNATDAAGERDPLPPGRYLCLVVNGELAESRTKATPSYKLTFEVVEPTDFAGRKLWHDLWLTPKALPTSKRDLAKLGIVRPDQLRQAPPAGMLADVRVALRTEDDGRQFNRVNGFEIIEGGTAPGTLDPDDDDTEGEGVPF